ncbi:MAG: uracil-DNA glycosylase [Betaproteobacteria bacterium]|nr:uracil-DNA glycosylase [Betaproteobacteria bacterium]
MTRLTRPLDDLLAADFGEWQPLLRRWRASAAGQALVTAVDERVAAGAKVYPAEVFRALALTPLSSVRVLILGQDPYHGPGQAEGLAFSVEPGQRLPPSLRNIFKELQRDLGLAMPATGSLVPWACQGVLLLNATLTVEDGLPGRHARLGWQTLTDEICKALVQDSKPKVFMLWGAHAQAKAALLQPPGVSHAVLTCNHPSPLSALRMPAPFVGCGHFGLANAFLQRAGRSAVDWGLARSEAVV